MPEMKTRLPYNTVPLKSGGFAGSGGLAPAARNTFFTGLSAVPCARAVAGADTAAAAAATAGAFFRNALRFDFGIIYLLIGFAAGGGSPPRPRCVPGVVPRAGLSASHRPSPIGPYPAGSVVHSGREMPFRS